MLCDLCQRVFSGSAEPSPEGHDEYLHHRSSRSFAIAVAEGCQLCLILQDILPEHMLTIDWEYRPLDQGIHAVQATPDQHTESLFPLHTKNFFYRPSYMGKRPRKEPLKPIDSAERNFALLYFRSANWDQLPTVEFLCLTSNGRAAIHGLFPLKVLLINNGPIPVEAKEQTEDYRYNSSSTSDLSARSVARSWLAHCVRKHGSSCAVRSKTFWPSRLVYLENASADQSEQTVKLCHAAQLKRANELPPSYMTLSYRWSGNTEQFMLSSNTTDQLFAGVPLNLLSQTFRDALQFASFCNVRHVWIDALCIKQDDVKDWETEAPLMGSIYYNAVCNLTVSGSGDFMNGLFSRRNPCHAAPLLISPDPKLWGKNDGTAINSQDKYVCIAQDFWERSVNQTVVNKRAWVMQERLLSVRKIFFSEHQLFWECRHTKACEAFPGGIPDQEDSITSMKTPFSQYQPWHGQYMTAAIDGVIRQQCHGGALPTIIPEVRNILLLAWTELLQRYNSCGITYAKDRLVAIKGISTYLGTAMDDDCIYGLWRKELPYQLFFMYTESATGDRGIQSTREQNVHAPTWSWAHHNRGFQMTPQFEDSENDQRRWGGKKTPLVTIIDILETLPPELEAGGTSAGPSRTPSSGCLHLKCHLFPCTVDSERWDENTTSRLHVVMHLGNQEYKDYVYFDGEWPDNGRIMPLYWHNETYGNALIVSRIGGGDSPLTFTRTGFLGTSPIFWEWFQMYWKFAGSEGEEIWLL